MFHVDAKPSGPSERTLTITAENTTAQPVAFDLPDRCPNGLLDFEGLGPGYDYYGTCTKGACARIGSPRRIELAPRQRLTIAETTITLDGTAQCEPALVLGRRYTIRAVVPPLPFPTCTGDALIEVLP
jgi:hypothetical protein